VKLYPDFGKAWNNLNVLYKFQIRKPQKAQQCADRIGEIAQKVKPSAGDPSNRISLSKDQKTQQIKKCIDCGGDLSTSQHICERCGASND
ncbi:MAG: hypothetical protein ACTSRK_15850, partial [Promethearchaeota archaeon]